MILVDADACPVKDIIIELAKKYHIELSFYFDTSHIFEPSFYKVIIVEKGHDSVDMTILRDVKENDIVITQDYGLASLCLLKKSIVLNQNGMEYTEYNIQGLLNNRYFGSVERKANKHIKGPKKRTKENNESFYIALDKILKKGEFY